MYCFSNFLILSDVNSTFEAKSERCDSEAVIDNVDEVILDELHVGIVVGLRLDAES